MPNREYPSSLEILDYLTRVPSFFLLADWIILRGNPWSGLHDLLTISIPSGLEPPEPYPRFLHMRSSVLNLDTHARCISREAAFFEEKALALPHMDDFIRQIGEVMSLHDVVGPGSGRPFLAELQKSDGACCYFSS